MYNNMPIFHVLLLKEHVNGEVERLDNKIFILYDTEEETFYYYGTRNDKENNKYVNYTGSYSYHQKKGFVSFLQYVMGNFEEVITSELHYLKIESYEYPDLDFEYIMNKTRTKTLMSAYDLQTETRKSIKRYVNMLVSA
jgi:hypothetical protein